MIGSFGYFFGASGESGAGAAIRISGEGGGFLRGARADGKTAPALAEEGTLWEGRLLRFAPAAPAPAKSVEKVLRFEKNLHAKRELPSNRFLF